MSEFKHGFIKSAQAATYQMMDPLLHSIYAEFSELSKKKPQDVLSENKVKVVNRILKPILEMLDGEPVRSFLDNFDEDDLPQNSDVILMLGQVRAAMVSFRNHHWDGRNGWHVESEED